MNTKGNLLSTAMIYAGGVGQFQGLIEFVKNNPDFYSREELITELIKTSDTITAKLEAVGNQ